MPDHDSDHQEMVKINSVCPYLFFDWDKIVALFQVLLGAMSLNEFNQKWWA